jgi:glutamine---fructose-6-phosphate transaminase (isomerizing)
VSQSGGSPDLVQSMEVARQQSALTLAVTNNAGSALAAAAEIHVDVLAGQERSVAATKSYTAELLALYLLLDRVRGGDGRHAAALPELGTQVLAFDELVRGVAQRYRFAQRLVTTGRWRRVTCPLKRFRVPICCTARSPRWIRWCRCSPWFRRGRAVGP